MPLNGIHLFCATNCTLLYLVLLCSFAHFAVQSCPCLSRSHYAIGANAKGICQQLPYCDILTVVLIGMKKPGKYSSVGMRKGDGGDSKYIMKQIKMFAKT